MKITDFLREKTIRVPLSAKEKTAAIRELVALLHESDCFADLETVLQAVLQRERIRSTGIGSGLAVPHAKCAGIGRLSMAVGKPAQPMDFDCADRHPCTMIVLLISPPNASQSHIQALAQVSRLWLTPAFRDAALGAETSTDLLSAFERFQP